MSSIEKAKKLLDYEPKVSFREGLEITYKWFVENWDKIKRSAEF